MIEIIIDAEATDDPIVTVEIRTGRGSLWLMGVLTLAERSASLQEAHVSGGGPGAWGASRLRWLARSTLEIWMSTKSLLKERFGQRVQIRDVDRVPSGSPAKLRLRMTGHANTVAAARALARRHVSMRTAHRVLTQLAEGHDRALVYAPCVEDWDRLRGELLEAGIIAEHHEPAEIDVRTVRTRLALSQEEFALRFGLDLSTLRNWEQGRSRPDAAARAALWTIAYSPDAVESAVAASGVLPPA